MDKTLESLINKVSEAQRRDMDRPFTKTKLEIALKSMHPSKAPSPNGAHVLFYQKYWRYFKNLYLSPINKTFTALIPKSQRPKKMDEYRSISICNVVYKIVAKAIANSLKRLSTLSSFSPN